MKIFTILTVILSTAIPLTAAEILTLTSSNGSGIASSVEPGQAPGTVNLIRSDGRLFKDVPVSSFSTESQAEIAKALEKYQKENNNADITKESRLTISFQRAKSATNNKYGDIDDRIVTIQPHIALESDERDKTYQDVKGEVIVIGKEVVAKDRWVILDRQSFSFPKLEPDKRETWEGTQFECRYDPDFAGFDYEGHVVFLYNKAGEVGMVKGSNSQWENLLPALVKANKGTGYDKNFSKTLPLYSTFGLPGTR